jgi:hypothetical protein
MTIIILGLEFYACLRDEADKEKQCFIFFQFNISIPLSRKDQILSART